MRLLPVRLELPDLSVGVRGPVPERLRLRRRVGQRRHLHAVLCRRSDEHRHVVHGYLCVRALTCSAHERARLTYDRFQRRDQFPAGK